MHFLEKENLLCAIKDVNVSHVLVYLMSLSNDGLAPTTIVSKMSALNFVFKLFKLPEPGSDFWIKEFLIGLKKGKPQVDVRIPVSIELLHSMLDLLGKSNLSDYDKALYYSMCTLMFHGFLRPGEVTGDINNLKLSHCKISNGSLNLTFFKFKHHKGPPYSIKIDETGSIDCPVRAMKKYLSLRNVKEGPLFCSNKGAFIPYKKLCDLMNLMSKFLNIEGKFSPHCFRIGAATWAASQGATDEQIMRMGRWSNNSFLKYIRLPTLMLKLKK